MGMKVEEVMMEVKRSSSWWVCRWLIMWRELVLQDDVVDDILAACLITHLELCYCVGGSGEMNSKIGHK